MYSYPKIYAFLETTCLLTLELHNMPPRQPVITTNPVTPSYHLAVGFSRGEGKLAALARTEGGWGAADGRRCCYGCDDSIITSPSISMCVVTSCSPYGGNMLQSA